MNTKFKLSYDQNEILPEEPCGFKYGPTPFSASDVINCSICEYELLTDEKERKVYYLKFSTENACFEYKPGSTIGVLPSNNEELVNKILIRLELEHVADQRYHLSANPNYSDKKATVPKHIPTSGTLRQVFLHNLDLKSVPKKLFLKRLLDYTEDEQEKEELSILSSPKSSEQYQTLISSPSNRSLLAILNNFPSCQPPVEIILEHLPPLLPRPYSISSSPLNKSHFSITFNIDTFDDGQYGVCTSWLEKCIKVFKKDGRCNVPLYMRIPSNFTLPEENSVPIIMIATGTGISPFRSFLEHRHLRIKEGAFYGKSWLFYGCRDSNKNSLFRKDLQDYLASRALSRLSEAFSRESENQQYVQDEIAKYEANLSNWIVRDGGVVFVCGDYLRVVPAVKEAIVNVLKFHFQEEDARYYLEEMVKANRFIVDNWN